MLNKIEQQKMQRWQEMKRNNKRVLTDLLLALIVSIDA